MTAALDLQTPTVRLELPTSWRQLSVRADGDRSAQHGLLRDWWVEQDADPATVPADLVQQLTRQSRRATREGIAFAAVLLARLDGPIVLSASLAVSFRRLPGAVAPAVAAEGVLQVLRRRSRPTQRLELIGLGCDQVHAVLLRDQSHVDGALLAVTEVLWLVPGTEQLANVAVASADLAIAPACTEVALLTAASLRVTGVGPMND